ncbi:hypothetical protein D3C71_1396530 [compost metagenome]
MGGECCGDGRLMGYARSAGGFLRGFFRASPILRACRMGEARMTQGKNPNAKRAKPIRQRWVLNTIGHSAIAFYTRPATAQSRSIRSRLQHYRCLMGCARSAVGFFSLFVRASPILRTPARARRMGGARKAQGKNPTAQRAKPIKQRRVLNTIGHSTAAF